MTNLYTCFIQKTPTDDPTFFIDESLVIKLNIERSTLSNVVRKFELTCYALKNNVYEIKYVHKCVIGIGQPIVILHILKNDGAIDRQTKKFNNTELGFLDLAQVNDRELFIFVIHNRQSLTELEKPGANLCTLNGATPETKDGTIIVSI